MAGGLLLVLGLVAARETLPEWAAPPTAADRAAAVEAVRAELKAAGGTPSRLTAKMGTGPGAQKSVGTAWRQLGSRARDWLVAAGNRPTWLVSGRLEVPGVGAGGFEATVGSDHRPRRVQWSTAGSMGSLLESRHESREAREGFGRKVLERLGPGAGLQVVPGERTESLGAGSVRYVPLAERPPAPREALVWAEPGGGTSTWSRDLWVDEDDSLSARVFDKVFVTLVPTALLVVLVVVLMGVLLFQRRVGFRVALALGALVVVFAVLSGSAFDGAPDVPAWIAVFAWSGRLFALGVVVALWAVAESVVRDTVPGFTTSLDSLVAGRLGPRLGRAFLSGLGAGAASAGLVLLTTSGAAFLAGRTLHPLTASFQLPFFGGSASPYYAGTWYAGTFVLAVGLLRRVFPRDWADGLAALLFALYLSTGHTLAPWGASLAQAALVAGAYGLVFRAAGLSALLVAAISDPLWRDLLASGRLISSSWMAFLLCAISLGALATVAVVALRRSEREDEGRVDAPDYVKRLESERRVTYEMGLLSKMQTALLPLAPPERTGFDLAARSTLATEAGGDLYDFLVDAEGSLWVVAGDVSGHGYSCGIQQAMVKAAFHSLATAGRSPGEVLGQVDRVLRTAGRESRLFTTLALLRIDPATGKGLLANAGHPFPLLVEEGRCREVAIPGLPLGQGPARTYEDVAIDVAPGAFLVIASDGLYEGPDRFDEPYGYDRPRTVLESVGLWRRPPDAVVDALLADWRLHVGEGAPADDTTVVVVRRPSLSW